jgi:hypothetical protein
MTTYVSRDTIKTTLGLTGQDYADADIDVAIEAASRGLENAYSTRWVQSDPGEVRYYTASSDREVALLADGGGVLAIDSVDVDYTIGDIYTGSDDDPWTYWYGGGQYATNIPSSSYRLLPIWRGATGDGGTGEPFETLQLARGARYLRWPRGQDAIRITGTFGWETVPAGVQNATTIIATRLLRRSRDAPFGIIGLGLEGAAVRASQIARDPDITFEMAAVAGPRTLLV